MTKPEKTKGMCIATRCTSVEQFIQMFARFVDEESFFVSTMNTRPPGLETSFSVQLQDGTPVLRGMCVVRESWTTPNNPFKTPGVRLGIKRLTANSTSVFEQLLASKAAAAKAPPIPPAPPRRNPIAGLVAAASAAPKAIPKLAETAPTKLTPSRVELKFPARPPTPVPVEPEISDVMNEPTAVNPNRGPTVTSQPGELKPTEVKLGATPDLTPPPADDSRTPGSDLVLPANPLMDLTDESLEGYVDCTLYEETGNFFPAEDDLSGAPLDDVIEPPAPTIPPPVISRTATPTFELQARVIDDLVSESSETTPVPALPGSTSLPPLTITPPGMSRDSAPVITARGSMPAVESLEPARPKQKSSSVWWLFGLFVLTAAGAGGWFLYSRGYLTTEPAKAQSSEPKPVALTPPPPPVQPEKVAEVETSDKPVAPPIAVEKPPAVEGAPLVGDGPCQLIVASTPAGSMVQLDGKVIAPSPITLATTCEAHKIDISHARYQTVTRNVTLTEGKRDSLEVNLPRPTHTVRVTSNPSGATLYIRGRRAGTTPTVLKVLGWETITLDFKKTGFQPVTEKLYSRRVEDSVSVRLVKW